VETFKLDRNRKLITLMENNNCTNLKPTLDPERAQRTIKKNHKSVFQAVSKRKSRSRSVTFLRLHAKWQPSEWKPAGEKVENAELWIRDVNQQELGRFNWLNELQCRSSGDLLIIFWTILSTILEPRQFLSLTLFPLKSGTPSTPTK